MNMKDCLQNKKVVAAYVKQHILVEKVLNVLPLIIVTQQIK